MGGVAISGAIWVAPCGVPWDWEPSGSDGVTWSIWKRCAPGENRRIDPEGRNQCFKRQVRTEGFAQGKGERDLKEGVKQRFRIR